MRRMVALAMALSAAYAGAGRGTPETSRLFERHVVPENGVEFYLLRPGLVDESQQSLYFTADAMTEDGRFLVFSAGKNEFTHPEIGKAPDARQLGFTLALVDFEKDEAFRLDIPRGIPFIDAKTDQLWYARKNGNSYRGGTICRRDLKVDPHKDVVECRIPDEIFAGVRREHWITTHITLTKNRRKAFIAFYMDDDHWEQGMINFDTGRFESWGRTAFYANHDQLNPQDDSLALIAREECWERPDGRAFMNRYGWYPRLYLARPDGSRELVPSKIVNNATHERWTRDGKGFYFCAPGPHGHSGVMYHDLATGDQTCICPMRCMHPSLTADGRYVAWDDYQSTKKYFRGRAFQIGFWNRETRRGIWAQPMGVAIATLERQSNLHPDGHPTFVGGDRYLAWTYLNADGHMDVALAPTAPLVARTQKADPGDKALFTGELKSGVEAVPGDGSVDFHDILIVGGTVEGVEKALELRQPTDFIPERVLVLTPFPYLGEDVAGTYELGFGESAPTNGLRAEFWRGTTDHARFDYLEDPPCRHPQYVFRNDSHERLSEPRPPVRIGDTVCHKSDVDVMCTLHEGESIISTAEVIVLEGKHTHDGVGGTADVFGEFMDGPRRGERIEFTRKPIELDLGLTEMKPFSYVAPIGSAVGSFKVTLRKDPKLTCQYLSRVWFHLADAADTVHVPTPLKVKKTLDRALIERGVDFMTSTAIDEVIRDKAGKIVGVRATNRSGTRTYRARRVIDATRYHALERWGEPLAVGKTETFSRIVMTSDGPPAAPGMKVERLPGEYPDRHTGVTGRVYRCTFDLPMKDGSYSSFATAEWQARELTWTDGELEDADLLTWHPKRGTKPGRDGAVQDHAYDVVVVGGGTAGAPAAIAAARAGAKVLVVEYVGVLGGIGTDGMISGYYDGNHCGFTKEFTERYRRIPNDFKYYARSETWRRMCREAGVTVWLGALGTGAIVEGPRVTGVVVGTEFGPQRASAKCVIDATGNSDIAAAAGAMTEFIDAREFALQSDGQSAQRLARGGYNSDFGYVDDSSAEDLMRFMVRARAGAPNAWNIARMPDSRERRRIVPDYMLSGPDVAANRPFPDTVVQARSRQDAHGYVRDLFGYVAEDSVPELLKLSGRPRARYDVNVPLRSLLPRGLSGVAVIGLGAGVERDVQPIIRMQADLMNMGYAVGTAAAMAARTAGGDFRRIDLAALKRTLVDKGNLRAEVLDWTVDTDVSSDNAICTAVKSLADDFKGSHVLWRKENRARALPLLREAYRRAATPKAQQIYAEMLGMLGDATGAEVLADIVTGKRAVIETRHGRNYGEGNEGGDAPLGFMVALGRSKSPLALKPLLHALSEISVTSTVRPFRAVTLALEALGDPAAAPRLAAKLREPGMGGHDVQDWRDLPPQGGYGGDPTIVKSIRELALARALLACGDHDGVGRKTYENYATDARGVLSAHARAVLKEYAR